VCWLDRGRTRLPVCRESAQRSALQRITEQHFGELESSSPHNGCLNMCTMARCICACTACQWQPGRLAHGLLPPSPWFRAPPAADSGIDLGASAARGCCARPRKPSLPHLQQFKNLWLFLHGTRSGEGMCWALITSVLCSAELQMRCRPHISGTARRTCMIHTRRTTSVGLKLPANRIEYANGTRR